MTRIDRYLDVGPALFSGYAVVLVRGQRCEGQALLDTAHDVAACAALMGLPVLTNQQPIVDACKALGVATALPPPQYAKKAWRYEVSRVI